MRSLTFLLLVAIAAASPLLPSASPGTATPDRFPGWPSTFDGRPLREIPLTAEEVRFAGAFPGRMARFTDGERHLLLRWVSEPTRRLHPAEECYRAWGYALTPQPIARDAVGRTWASWIAEKNGRRLTVRERIEGPDGRAWTDVSSWYWENLLFKQPNGWMVVTITSRS